MSEEYSMLLVTAGFLMLALVAFRFWVPTNEVKLRFIELSEENKRFEARYRTSCSPTDLSHDAIIAAFIFDLVSASPPASKGHKHDRGCQQRMIQRWRRYC